LTVLVNNLGNSTVRWTRNQKELRQTKYVKLAQEMQAGMTSCSVKFEQVFPEDEGDYVCTIVRGGNTLGTSKGVLKVNPAAQPESPTSLLNLVKMEDVNCEEGDSATFQTEIIGFQPQTKLKVQWFRENALIPESEDFEMMQEGPHLVLLIKGTYEEDSGTFTVRVTDTAKGNQAESSARLIVKSN